MEKRPIFGDDHILPRVDPLPFSARTWELWKNFIDTYRAYVDDYYAEQYLEFPEEFPFKQPLEWIFVYKNQEFEAHIFPGEGDSCKYEYFQFVTLGESRAFSRLPPYLQEEKEKDIIGRSDKPLAMIRYKYGLPAPALTYDPNYVTEDPDDLAKMGEVDGRAAAKRHGERARKKKEERFDLFGIEEIIPIVNDKHFEYEMSEAIAAYKHKLFLAATAVTGVALENILVLILKKNKLFSSKTKPYIKDYLAVLVENELLEDRKRRDIMNFNNTRNGVAHSNSGVVMASHAEEGFTVIKYLVKEFY